MKWQGKLLGLFIGVLLIGGLPGVILGLVVGHIFDSGLIQQWLMPIHNQYQQTNVQRIFFDATFAVMGYLAKIDGRVSESEIKATERVMQQMGLNDSMRREAIRLFNEGKQPNYDWHAQLNRLRQACRLHSNLLRTFLEIQLQMVYSEGRLTYAKHEALKSICAQLGVSEAIFEQFAQQSHAEQQYRQHSQRSYPDPQRQINDAYQILGVSPNVTDAELKKAYRRLMSKHHPDKLVAQGLPPAMMKLATEKTQKIKNAYEIVRKARGLST